jgi:hypothetical protein
VEDGYVHQPVQTSLKLFMPGDCATPYAPQFNSVGTKVSNFRPAVEGIVGQIHGSLVSEPLAYAKGQTWRTADFNGSYTPFREGKNDIVGKIVMVRQRGFFSIGQQEVPLPTLEVSALPLPPGAPADFADTVGVYTISGVLAGLASMIYTSKTGSAQSNIGVGYETDAIAAAVLGGTSFAGGIATIPGCVLGIFIIGLIYNGMNMIGVSSYYQSIVKGLIIIGAVMLDMVMNKNKH